MKEKRKDCLYCGNKMENVKTVRKKFCSDLCRVKFNQQFKMTEELKSIINNSNFNKLSKDAFMDLILFSEGMNDKVEIEKDKMVNNLKFINSGKEGKKGELVISGDKKLVEKINIETKKIEKPQKMEGESGIDYAIRLAEWIERNNIN